MVVSSFSPRPMRQQPVQRLLDQPLRFRIQRGRGLVQQQDIGILRDGPGDDDPLPLPPAQLRPPLPHLRVVPVGEGRYEVVRVGQPRRADDLLLRRGGTAVRYVGSYRSREQDGVLGDDADPTPVGLYVDPPEVATVDEDASRERVVEPFEEIDHGRLAAAGRSDEGDGRSGGDFEGHAREDRSGRPAGVREAHVAEGEGASSASLAAVLLKNLRLLSWLGVVVGVPIVDSLGFFHSIAIFISMDILDAVIFSRIIPLSGHHPIASRPRRGRFTIQQREHLIASAGALHQARVRIHNVHGLPLELTLVQHERQQDLDGEPSTVDERRADEEQGRLDARVDEECRYGHVVEALRVQLPDVEAVVPLDHISVLVPTVGFAREGDDGTDAPEGFLGDVVGVGQGVLHLPGVPAEPLAVQAVDDADDGDDGDGAAPQQGGAYQHVRDDAADANDALDREAEEPGEVRGHLPAVGRQTGGQLARGVGIEEGHLLTKYRREDVQSDSPDDAEVGVAEEEDAPEVEGGVDGAHDKEQQYLRFGRRVVRAGERAERRGDKVGDGQREGQAYQQDGAPHPEIGHLGGGEGDEAARSAEARGGVIGVDRGFFRVCFRLRRSRLSVIAVAGNDDSLGVLSVADIITAARLLVLVGQERSSEAVAIVTITITITVRPPGIGIIRPRSPRLLPMNVIIDHGR
mmetsp:Transcript_33805/g.100828  ORF Transcript_33805/g.100828 Transcript_33805/m.100828 type:complete len:689 (-) Transcript_33805:282-2348(-)